MISFFTGKLIHKTLLQIEVDISQVQPLNRIRWAPFN